MKAKKIAAVLCAALMTLSLSACGGSGQPETTESTENTEVATQETEAGTATAEGQVYTVGIVQLVHFLH